MEGGREGDSGQAKWNTDTLQCGGMGNVRGGTFTARGMIPSPNSLAAHRSPRAMVSMAPAGPVERH